MGWLAISFYTTGTGYAKEVENLKASAVALKVPLTVYSVPPRGSWRRNLDWKSAVILKAMDENPGLDIVFLDADARIRSWPAVFDHLSFVGEWDLAACLFKESRLERDELLSGTLWIRNCPETRRLVEAWDRYGRRHPEIRHQKCLSLVIRAWAGEVRFYRLKNEYTRIYDHPGMRGVTPIIEHFQASRRFRGHLRPILPPQRNE